MSAPKLFGITLKEHGVEDLSEAVYIEVLKVGFRLFEHARPQVAKACFHGGNKAHILYGFGLH